jgi:hypothetical protein
VVERHGAPGVDRGRRRQVDSQKGSSVCRSAPARVRKCRTRHGPRVWQRLGWLGMAAGQPVTVKVADATVPLWRPLAWNLSLRPG